MTPQELKNSVLQLAIQGKLVEQRPEEGTGEELYRQIQAENLPTDKSVSTFSDDEIPFDIPKSWMMVRLKNVAILHNGRAYKQSELLKIGKYPVLRVGNLFTNNDWYFSDFELESEKYCDTGDLLYSWSASFGPHIWNGKKVIYHYHIWKIEFSKYISKKYLYYYLLADTEKIKQSGHGLAMIHVTKSGTEQRAFPLPPLAEQKRIVSKIEELLSLIDRYEKAWSRLEDFNKRFPTDMQKSLLQLAIQGKLVEQRPEEGAGEELYRQIQAEKQALIKAGKIKKDKPLPEITEDEVPFEIPESWKWVHWGDLSESIQYGYNAPAQESGRIKMVRISDIHDGKVLWDNVPYCEIAENDIATYLLAADDILFARTGGTVGKSYLVTEVPEEAIYAGYLIRTRYSNSLCSKYLKFFMDSDLYWNQLRNGTIATAQPNCNGKTLSKMILPLPPLAEQKRIVAKLEELLPLCERLK